MSWDEPVVIARRIAQRYATALVACDALVDRARAVEPDVLSVEPAGNEDRASVLLVDEAAFERLPTARMCAAITLEGASACACAISLRA